MARNGGDKRGSAATRRARKTWMLATFGDGITAPCTHCGRQLTYSQLEADRVVPGGPYRRSNIQPADGACNKARSNDLTWAYVPA